MKTCLICGTTAQDNCATCPKCGEASWPDPVTLKLPAEFYDVTSGALSVGIVEAAAEIANRLEQTDAELEELTKPEPPVARKVKR